MLGYAYPTSFGRDHDRLRRFGWAVIAYPSAHAIPAGFAHALDCRRRRGPAGGTLAPWTRADAAVYAAALRRIGEGADFIVLPDAAEVRAHVALADDWAPAVLATTRRALIAVHRPPRAANGLADRRAERQQWHAIRKRLSPAIGLFIAAAPEWLALELMIWGRRASAAGCYLHIAAADTLPLIRAASIAGAASTSRSEATRRACRLPELDAWQRQPDLLSVLRGPP